MGICMNEAGHLDWCLAGPAAQHSHASIAAGIPAWTTRLTTIEGNYQIQARRSTRTFQDGFHFAMPRRDRPRRFTGVATCRRENFGEFGVHGRCLTRNLNNGFSATQATRSLACTGTPRLLV